MNVGISLADFASQKLPAPTPAAKRLAFSKYFRKFRRAIAHPPVGNFPSSVFLAKAVLNQNVLFYLPRQMWGKQLICYFEAASCLYAPGSQPANCCAVEQNSHGYDMSAWWMAYTATSCRSENERVNARFWLHLIFATLNASLVWCYKYTYFLQLSVATRKCKLFHPSYATKFVVTDAQNFKQKTTISKITPNGICTESSLRKRIVAR